MVISFLLAYLGAYDNVDYTQKVIRVPNSHYVVAGVKDKTELAHLVDCVLRIKQMTSLNFPSFEKRYPLALKAYYMEGYLDVKDMGLVWLIYRQDSNSTMRIFTPKSLSFFRSMAGAQRTSLENHMVSVLNAYFIELIRAFRNWKIIKPTIPNKLQKKASKSDPPLMPPINNLVRPFVPPVMPQPPIHTSDTRAVDMDRDTVPTITSDVEEDDSASISSTTPQDTCPDGSPLSRRPSSSHGNNTMQASGVIPAGVTQVELGEEDDGNETEITRRLKSLWGQGLEENRTESGDSKVEEERYVGPELTRPPLWQLVYDDPLLPGSEKNDNNASDFGTTVSSLTDNEESGEAPRTEPGQINYISPSCEEDDYVSISSETSSSDTSKDTHPDSQPQSRRSSIDLDRSGITQVGLGEEGDDEGSESSATPLQVLTRRMVGPDEDWASDHPSPVRSLNRGSKTAKSGSNGDAADFKKDRCERQREMARETWARLNRMNQNEGGFKKVREHEHEKGLGPSDDEPYKAKRTDRGKGGGEYNPRFFQYKAKTERSTGKKRGAHSQFSSNADGSNAVIRKKRRT